MPAAEEIHKNIPTKALELLSSISEIYAFNKKYFIKAEECMDTMDLFIAPLIEHRDALDHIMRYFNNIDKADIKQLDKALGHEVRAFFDVADYICINIRSSISKNLEKMSPKKIQKIWSDYIKEKEKIRKISDEIAQIRLERSESKESVLNYIRILDEIFDLYNNYSINIDPRIKISIN